MHNKVRTPFIFDEFFASGKEETISPFLTPSSRNWGKNLTIKVSLISACFLLLAFISSFINHQVAYLLLSIVYFLSGTPAFIGALEDIQNLNINIDVLMTLAALLSVLIGSGFEGALLLVLFELSGSMEESVSQKTKSTLMHLHRLAPKMASVWSEDGHIFECSVREILIGTKILVKAGEIVPLDGLILEGGSFVNLIHLTGESQALAKKPGDEIQAGARNLEGSLTIQVTKTNADSTLNQIIQLILEAQEAKPKTQQLLDRFGKWYATIIILLSLLFGIFLPFIFSITYLGEEGSIYRALTFLIAASPCALIIATPTAYLCAINSCAKKGILLKGGIALDAVNKSSIVAFDKTGTLTTGKLTCISINPCLKSKTSFDPQVALAIAAGLEQHAVHPIAEAIISFAKKAKAPAIAIQEFKSVPGFGLEGMVEISGEQHLALIGHALYISSKIPSSIQKEWELFLNQSEEEANLTTFLLITRTTPSSLAHPEQKRQKEHRKHLEVLECSIFSFHFFDTIRQDALKTIDKLKSKGLFLIMLTGDRLKNAREVGKILGLDEIFAQLRPEDKLLKVAELSKEKGLMMVGDGINDAPALSRATVGISMGKIGSATAIDASDVVFLQDDLLLIDWLFEKAATTIKILKQNLALALGIICLATTPAIFGFIPLWMAVILHEGGTVLVGLNSLRLLKNSAHNKI